MGADRLASFEPAHVDELAILLRWAMAEIQEEAGKSVLLGRSTFSAQAT